LFDLHRAFLSAQSKLTYRGRLRMSITVFAIELELDILPDATFEQRNEV
jgi:hypothetical protein